MILILKMTKSVCPFLLILWITGAGAIGASAEGGQLSEVPAALRGEGLGWCNENNACIVFGRNEMTWTTIEGPACPILRIDETKPRTYRMRYSCGGKVFDEMFTLEENRIIQRFWKKVPVGHWDFLAYERTKLPNK